MLMVALPRSGAVVSINVLNRIPAIIPRTT
jgi:hypothetical protein